MPGRGRRRMRQEIKVNGGYEGIATLDADNPGDIVRSGMWDAREIK